jgi:enoyl-CoA hydratase/carnithine racemase
MWLFERIEADPGVRVLALTGTGRAFSAGYDLGSIAERASGAAEEQTAGSARPWACASDIAQNLFTVHF